MNKEEIKFYSIGRGSLNLDGKFYYGLDYAITDFMRNLEQENNQLKEQLENASNNYTKYIQERDNKIDKLEDKITQMHKRFINGLCIDNYLGGRKTKILFEEMFEILKDSDVDE